MHLDKYTTAAKQFSLADLHVYFDLLRPAVGCVTRSLGRLDAAVHVAPVCSPPPLSAFCEVSDAAFDISTGWEMTAECF